MKTWLHSLNLENGQANINVKECVEIVKKLGLEDIRIRIQGIDNVDA